MMLDGRHESVALVGPSLTTSSINSMPFLLFSHWHTGGRISNVSHSIRHSKFSTVASQLQSVLAFVSTCHSKNLWV
ncbi:hypothetical protein EI94DRAFT_1715973 [Lactarius quietus]|nr:hypothetical protein EI94DRAFT_1715973 [Lactarius quietus]